MCVWLCACVCVNVALVCVRLRAATPQQIFGRALIRPNQAGANKRATAALNALE